MILHALCTYYTRMSRDPKSGMPRPGFSAEKISFGLSLRPDGSLARVVDLREHDGKKSRPRVMLVPAAVKRAVNVAPNFLWDNTGYVLGVDGKGKPERTAKTFEAFRALHELAASSGGSVMLQAVTAFLRDWTPDRFDNLPGVDPATVLDSNCVFMWDDSLDFIHDQPDAVRPEAPDAEDGSGAAWCLVTGRKAKAARLHPSIKGVRGGQSSGGALVSFNLEAFTSYGKEQSYNAPVSEHAASAYTAALNYLLDRKHKRCLQIGDASTVFWAEEASRGEDLLLALLAGPGALEERDGADAQQAQPVKGESHKERSVAQTVDLLLQDLIGGRSIEEALPDINPNVRFYILGLAPNAARIAVRFWHAATFGELAANAANHQRDIAIERQYDNQPEYPTLWHLLVDTAPLRKTENISPPLAAGLARAVFTGGRYPHALLAAAVSRIRADKEVTYTRAALIKGCLTRTYTKEVPFMLDTNRQDVPYLLGRLFALLEKAQLDALGAINATIRDKYIGSASSMPATVFPRLLHMAQYHISKAEYGGHLESRIAEVADNIGSFPARLALPDQGAFFLGYYQQRNANYRKPPAKEA